MNISLALFGQPAALLLIPCAWLLLWLLYRQQRHGSHWQKTLPGNFLPWLLQQEQGRQHKMPWLLLAGSTLLAGIALSAPQLPGKRQGTANIPDPLVIVMELTADMLASDLPPSRLHQLRSKASAMLQTQLPGHTAMVVYAGSAHTLLPLSADPDMADNLLQALHPALLPRPGRDAGAAIGKALALLQQGANGHGRIALLTSSLADTEQATIARLLHSQHGIKLGIIGVGSLQGAPVPALDNGGFDAAAPLSRLDEARLQQFAQQQGAGYARMQHANDDLLLTGLFARSASGRLQPASSTRTQDRGYWLVLPVLLLLAPLARKGWLFAPLLALPLLSGPGQPLAADTVTDIAGQIRQDPTTALQQLQDPFWLGIAAYHAGNYQLARDYFAGIPGASAHYNRGNSLMRLGRYSAAAAAYLQALELQPELTQARDNLALARQLQQQARARSPIADNRAGNAAQTATNRQEQDGKTATLQPIDPAHPHSSLDSWLQQIPDNPAALLKRKFRRELSQPAP